MKFSDIKDPAMLKPVLTSEGKPWVQRCYVCSKSINLIKSHYMKIGTLVRHTKCRPEPIK